MTKQKISMSKPLHHKQMTIVNADENLFSIPNQKPQDKLVMQVKEGKTRKFYNTSQEQTLNELLQTNLVSCPPPQPSFVFQGNRWKQPYFSYFLWL